MERLFNIDKKWEQYTVEVISIFFILLFSYAAATHLMQFGKFEIQLKQFPYIKMFATTLAWVLPTVLVLNSFLLLIPKFRSQALLLAFILMLLFSLYFIVVLGSGVSLPCSCRGLFTSLSWEEHMIFNIVSTSVALLGVALTNKQ